MWKNFGRESKKSGRRVEETPGMMVCPPSGYVVARILAAYVG
jgi:hypothetical protein